VSVLDEFRDAEKRVAKRLKELEPVVAEYRELEAVAKRLGIEPAKSADASSATRPRRQRSGAASGKSTGKPRNSRRSNRTVPGQREQQIVALVRERPGITVRELGETLGVDPTGLYRVVHRLEQGGAVRKNGRSLEPAA
jgi:Winged helix-turn-helix DNA-binding